MNWVKYLPIALKILGLIAAAFGVGNFGSLSADAATLTEWLGYLGAPVAAGAGLFVAGHLKTQTPAVDVLRQLTIDAHKLALDTGSKELQALAAGMFDLATRKGESK